MSTKKELHKIKGEENTVSEQAKRQLNSEHIYKEYYVKEREIQTWKKKGEPRSSWYPEIPDQHVYGVKR